MTHLKGTIGIADKKELHNIDHLVSGL